MFLLESAHGGAGELIHFQCSADADEIVGVKARCRVRIDLGQLGVERVSPLGLCDVLMSLTQRLVAAWCCGEPIQQGSDPKKRSPADDGQCAACSDVGDPLLGHLRPLAGIDRLVGIDDIDQMMRTKGTFLSARLSRADVELAVDLDAVGAQHFSTKGLSQAGGEGRLAACRGAHHNQEAWVLAHVSGGLLCVQARASSKR